MKNLAKPAFIMRFHSTCLMFNLIKLIGGRGELTDHPDYIWECIYMNVAITDSWRA